MRVGVWVRGLQEGEKGCINNIIAHLTTQLEYTRVGAALFCELFNISSVNCVFNPSHFPPFNAGYTTGFGNYAMVN